MASQQADTGAGQHTPAPGGRGRHGLLMLACCIPMIVVAVLLVVTNTAGTGAVLVAFGCMAMMAVMMLAMPGRHDDR